MKFILIFIFCFITKSSHGLKASQHYKFNYFSSFKTGIPQDGEQAVGVSLKAVLDVYLENQDGIAIFKLSDVTTVEFIEDLGSNQETEFPDDRFHSPVDKVFQSALEQPFRANLRSSQPFSIEYEETEHRWLSNVRKGIAQVFKNEVLKGNFETQEEKDSVSSFFHQGHLVNIFNVKEETIFGMCKVYYEIHEINDGFVSTGDVFLPTQKSDSEEGLYRVVRSVNFDKCNEKVVINAHTTNEMIKNGEKPSHTRSSVSTFVLRGSPGHFVLYSAVVEGVITFPLSLFDEHEAHSITKQKLLLIDQSTNEEIPTLGPNLKHSTTWMHLVWSPFTLPKDSRPLPWIVYANENEFHDPNVMYGSPPLNPDQISSIKVKILEIIESSSKILTDINYETNETDWRNVPDLMNMVTYYIKLLDKKDITKIFDHFYERKVKLEWRLIIDAAAASGSYNAFEAILDYISQDKLEPFQIRNVFSTLGSSDGVLNVTRIINYIGEMNPIENSSWSTVLLNFAHYLSEFCINKAHNYNPANELFIEECVDADNKLGVYLYQAILTNEKLSWERTFAIRVLEELKTMTNFRIFNEIIDGSLKNSSNQMKAMALRALKNQDPDRDSQQSQFRKPAMDLLQEVYTDFNQDFPVRAAALVSFLSWQPSTSFWYKLAQSTWHEPSKDFSSFTSYLINLYADEKVPALEKQWKDAYSASKFAKEPPNLQGYSPSSIFDIFFKNYAKISELSSYELPIHSNDNFLFEIFTKENGFNLLKYENYLMYSEEEDEGEDSNESHSEEFFDKFLKEIGQKIGLQSEKKITQIFFKILGNSPSTMPPKILFDPVNFKKDAEDENINYGGRFLKFIERHNFFPNELGLPVFTFNSLPVIFSITTKQLPHKPGQVFANQKVLRASADYSRGAGVYLPWSLKSHSAITRSSIELNIPVGIMRKRILGTEGPLRTDNEHYSIAFEKKFPAIRLSQISLALIFNFGAVTAEDTQLSFVRIRKSDIKEKIISEVHPFTGIKYDLVMRADTTNSDFRLRDFQRFPKIPFRFWALELFINKEESETKELSMISTHGLLQKSGEATEKNNEEKQKYPTISNSDTPYERSEKLTSIFEGPKAYFELKLNFVGEKERNFEIFTVFDEKSDVNTKGRLGFTRGQIPGTNSQPTSFCIDWKKKTSSREEIDSSFISNRNISKEMKVKFLFNCSQPILKAHGLYSMSEEGREESRGKIKSKHENSQINTNLNLLFDTIDIEASYATDIESYDLVVTQNVFDSIRNLVKFPSIKRFTDENHLGNVTLRIHRNTYHKKWDLHLKTSSGDVLLTTFSDTNVFKLLSGVLKSYPEPEISTFALKSTPNSRDKCILQQNSVTTFDGVHYRYQPSTCWTLASYFRSLRFGTEKRVILIRAGKESSNIPDFKFIEYGREIEFSNNELKLNGKIVDRLSDDSPDLKTVVENTIFKSGHHYLFYDYAFSISPTFIVSNDKIEIYDYDLDTDYGLCGNGDGRTNPEFVGPKHCIYNDPQMFVASWTGQSDTCDATTLGEYRKGVEDFQAECKTYQENDKDVQMNERCLTFGFMLRKFEEDKYCISAKPSPFCANQCNFMNATKVEVTFKCWPKEKAPSSLLDLIERNRTFIFQPIPVEPVSYEHISTYVATYCKNINAH